MDTTPTTTTSISAAGNVNDTTKSVNVNDSDSVVVAAEVEKPHYFGKEARAHARKNGLPENLLDRVDEWLNQTKFCDWADGKAKLIRNWKAYLLNFLAYYDKNAAAQNPDSLIPKNSFYYNCYNNPKQNTIRSHAHDNAF